MSRGIRNASRMPGCVIVDDDAGAAGHVALDWLRTYQARSVNVQRALLDPTMGGLSQAGVVVMGLTSLVDLVKIRKLRKRLPSPAVMTVGTRLTEGSRLMTDAARAGVDQCFTRVGRADRDELIEAVGRRLEAPPPRQAIEVIARDLPTNRVRAIALYCLRAGISPTTSQQVSTRVGFSRWTLSRWFRAADLGSVASWLSVGRQLYVLELRRRGYSLTQIATRLDYATTAGVAMQLRRSQDRWERLLTGPDTVHSSGRGG